MNAIRSILVHLDGSPRSQVRLRLARSLAAEHAAALTAMLAVAPAFADFSLAYASGPEASMLVQQADEDRRRRARELFDVEAAAPGAPMRWAELGMEPTVQGFVRRCLLSDLVVMGQRDPDDALAFGVPPDMVESVVTGSGKPVLVVPYAGEFASVGATVLIAWKPTREAAAAVAAALPLLRSARKIHVLCAQEEASDEGPSADEPALDGYLRAHGVLAPIERHGGLRAEVGESLMSMAADVSADLMVMGCYGHTRVRELLLGGVTRTVLRSMTLPVLMAH